MKHIGTQTLTTEHLTLRCFTIEDAEYMYENWAKDPEVTTFMSWREYKSVAEVQEILSQWIAEYERLDYYNWAIELNELEQPIGSISVTHVLEQIQAAEVGYCLGKEYWNKGYMSEALARVVQFLFEEAGVNRIQAQHDKANLYSGKVLEKCGFLYEGTRLQGGYNNTGICDLCLYGIVREAEISPEETEEVEETHNTVTKVAAEDGTMKNVISDDTIEYVGILAKLELKEEEKEQAKKDMGEMLDYIDQLNELDTSGVEPMSHVFPVHNVFRDDLVTNGDGSADTLANAPLQKNGGFQVPKTIG